jgi:hypothetical protein
MWNRPAHFQPSTRVRLRDVCMPQRLRVDDSNHIAFTHHQIGIRMISS